MQYTPSTAKKIGVVYGLLVILLFVALFVRFWQGKNLKTPVNQTQVIRNNKVLPTIVKSPLVGKISLQTSNEIMKSGETGKFTVMFEAAGKKLDGIDMALRFDPRIINVMGFSEGNYFRLYPRKDINNTLGTVNVTALDPASSLPLDGSKTTLGVIQFTAKAPGTSQVNFDFITEATNKTVLTEQGTSQNILGSANGITITVEP